VTKTVTVLGTGIMGAAMARNLVRAGFDVTVWNRSRAKAEPLADDGATVASEAAAAVRGADVVLTMLFDATAVEDVMTAALPAMAAGPAVWVQSSTVGLDGAARLAALAEAHGVTYVDAPVLGTRQPAEDGKLIVLAGCPAAARDAVTPVFDAIGGRTVWVGETPDAGHRLKLVANSWVLSVTASTAQAVAMAGGLDLDPHDFLDVISGGPLDCAYAQLKGNAMVDGDFAPAFPLGGAVKDAGLVAAALRAAHTDDSLMVAMERLFRSAGDAGHAADDMAAVVRAMTDRV
jgi:3-hydroxyisobutyrate dehydrogenase